MSDKHYHGKPCKKCGGTLRFISNTECVYCRQENRKRSREKRAGLAKRRKIYDGKPCKVCGNTKRYVSNDNCIKCKLAKPDKYYYAKRAQRALDNMKKNNEPDNTSPD